MRILTWLIRVVGVLLVVVIEGAAIVFFAGQRALSQHLSTPHVSALNLTRVDATRGEHIVKSMTDCEECHGVNLGGKLFLNDAALGKIYAPNLTSGAGGCFATHNDRNSWRRLFHGKARANTRFIAVTPVRSRFWRLRIFD